MVVTMDNGLDKEFDLSKKELNAFVAWYDAKDAGRGASFFAIDKHIRNPRKVAYNKVYNRSMFDIFKVIKKLFKRKKLCRPIGLAELFI
ncbi:hypothetical protein BK135_10450 [Paenibacillus peoriae]|nr:hypothetical protein BK135_10450 [Paenibacillus peoriae]